MIRVDASRLEELQRVLVRLAVQLRDVAGTPASDLGCNRLQDAAGDFAAAWDARRTSTADELLAGATTLAETRRALKQLDEAYRIPVA